MNFDEGIGTPDWELSLWLLLNWAILFLITVKGIKSSGKIAWFTAIFPYIVLLILLIRAVTLEGAGNGILQFIKPDLNKLEDPQVDKFFIINFKNNFQSFAGLVSCNNPNVF